MSLEYIDLKREDASCRVYLFGATITSWKVEEKELIFVSPKAVFDGVKAIRGGVPVCFPAFGPWSYGAQHGFARTSNWKVAHPAATCDNGDVVLTLRLTDTEESRKIWDFAFTLDYKITLSGNSLKLEFGLTNSCEKELEFTTALHTYFKVDHVTNARILGLTGLKYLDKTQEGTPTLAEEREEVTLCGWTDRVYLGPCPPVTLAGVEGGRVRLTSSNLPDSVVWNPWSEKAAAMGDLGGEAWPGMVCVEAGHCVEPVHLPPGQKWSATHLLEYTRD